MNIPTSLLIFMGFNTVLSLVILPLSFMPLMLLFSIVGVVTSTALTSAKPNKKTNTYIMRFSAYSLVIVTLLLVWQSLEIPSLIAISAILTALSWAKICELKSNRDTKFIWILSSISLALHMLILIQYQTLIALVGLILLLITAAAFNQNITKRFFTTSNKLLFTQLSFLLAASLPFALILFVTLPRINLPMQELGLALGLPIAIEAEKNLAAKGLGKELGFNDIGEQGQSDSRVLLASLPTDYVQNSEQPLYWRGPVYWNYTVKNNDGNAEEKWQLRKDFSIRSKRQYNGFGSNKALKNMTSMRDNTLEYSVILMPHGEYWLYALDLPAKLTGESYLSQDYQLLSIRTVDTMWRYKIKSSLNYQISAKEPQAQLTLGLQYPKNNPQIKALGQQWAQQFINSTQSTTDIIKHAELFFKQGKYLYANNNEPYTGENQLDQFLFNRKLGYSQHYASSLTLLLRAAGIPARLVAGYRGAEKVGLTNMYTVNEHHAHAWVEAYVPFEQTFIEHSKNNSSNQQATGHWQRIDPALWLTDLFSSNTEQRTEQGAEQGAEQLSEQKNSAITELAASNKSKKQKDQQKNKAKQQATSWLDNLNQWTLNFDAQKQSTLAGKLGIKHLLWWHLVAIAFALLLLLALSIYLSLRYLNRSKKLPAHVQVYHKLCKKLAKKGTTRLPYEGAQSYFTRCANEKHLQDGHFEKLSQTYLKLAYGNSSEAEKKQLITKLRLLSREI